jgi:hypothetical protein
MSYFDDASLVMIPSGYKTSKVYSVKPIDGTGDLTFTRASTATRVNASGLVEAVSSNVPRLDYLNSTCPRLIIEPSRTNLILQSEALNTTWSPNGTPTITANTTVSPDGTTNADTLAVAIAGNGVFQAFTVTISAAHSFSVYLKNISSATNVLIGCDTLPSNATINFNTVTGAIIGTGAGITSSSVTNAGNGWYRVQGTYTSTGVANTLIIYGQGVMSFSAWGAQVEAGAYPTSYIPTTTASVTRLAESSSSASVPSLFGATEGSFFIECTFDGRNTNGAIPLFLRSSVSTSFNQATYLQFGTSDIILNVYSGGTSQAQISGGSFTTGQTLKIAFGYKANDFVLYINGVQIGTDTSGVISTSLSFIDLGSYLLLQSTYQYDGKISQALLFKTRLSNSSLAELTTI